MAREGTIGRAIRVYEFLRHIPFYKLVRRLELNLQRFVHDYVWGSRVGRPRSIPALPRVTSPPLPLFPPKAEGLPTQTSQGWRFEFLNRPFEMCGSGLDWGAPGLDPAHQLWRMNLHYMEFLEGVGDLYWSQFVLDWIASNQQTAPGAWKDSWNSYALSVRVVVWMQELARRDGRLDPEISSLVDASLVAQLFYLEDHLETDLGGNHLIKNITALIWSSAFFFGEDARRWRKSGLKLLSQELDKQILEDGVHYERSASYHAQVFADLLNCRQALGGDPLDERLDVAIKKMAQIIADLSHPDGRAVLFNDSGLSMAACPEVCLQCFERVYNYRPVPRRIFAFASSGYFGFRSSSTYFVVDCGRIGPDDLPAHAHGDILSFEWSVNGERLIVDQGVFEYISGDRRRWSRTTASHNTLCIPGADQADFFGAFRCGRRPNVRVLSFQELHDGFVLEGTHDGFAHLPGSPMHARRFQVSEGRVTIQDRLAPNAGHQSAISFLLHPDTEVSVLGPEATLSRGRTTVQMYAEAPIVLQKAAWWPDMGREIATTRLSIRIGRDGWLTTDFRVRSGGEGKVFALQ
jgi:hypothetical protein